MGQTEADEQCQVYNSKQDTAKDAPIFTLARNSDDFIYPCGTALHGVEVRCGEKKNNRKGVEQDDRNVKICGKSTAW